MNRTSSITVILLVGLSEDIYVRMVLFVIFYLIYFSTLIGNTILIIVSICDPRLHTPMYFFLANLSFIDVCYSSAIVPNMLGQLITRKRMTFHACQAQLYTFMIFACTETLLLSVMAYDRFVSISFALRYNEIMSKLVCIKLMACCWICGSLLATMDFVFTLKLPFCGHNVVDHFFCELNAIIKMACGDTFSTEMVIFIVGVLAILFPAVVILFSYTRIVVTIVGIRSSEGRYKAFSTCASHLIVVIMGSGAAIFMYMKPVSKSSENQEKYFSVLYTVMPSVMNPIIYSLRNNEVKRALKKVTRTYIFRSKK
ncbi:olfactory receptor 2D3-like [Lissotriton helveticus]